MGAGAEGHAGIDLDRQQSGRHAVADVAWMDPEWPDLEGAERALILGDPVLLGKLFPRPVAFELWPVALAEQLDPPRTVARDLAAGDDEAVLGKIVQRLFGIGAFGGGYDPPGCPTTHAGK